MKIIPKKNLAISRSRLMQSKKGQVIIINIVMMVMALLVFMAILPVIKSQIDSARNYDVLNCKQTDPAYVCSSNGGQTPCYNATYAKSEDTACAMLSIFLPYILIIVLLMGAAKLMANRLDSMMAPQSPYG